MDKDILNQIKASLTSLKEQIEDLENKVDALIATNEIEIAESVVPPIETEVKEFEKLETEVEEVEVNAPEVVEVEPISHDKPEKEENAPEIKEEETPAIDIEVNTGVEVVPEDIDIPEEVPFEDPIDLDINSLDPVPVPDIVPEDIDKVEPVETPSENIASDPVDISIETEFDDLPEDPAPSPIEPVQAEVKPDPKPAAKVLDINEAESLKEKKTVNDSLAPIREWEKAIPGSEVKNIISAISLNDRVLFINTLFAEDPLLFRQTIDDLNSMQTLKEGVSYIESKFDNWNMDSDVVYRFMMAVRRKLK